MLGAGGATGDTQKAPHHANRRQTIPDQAYKRVDGVDRIDGLESDRADELVAQWAQEYRQRNPDKLKSGAEIEQAIASSRSDWLAYAHAEITSTRALWRARTPAKAWMVSEFGRSRSARKLARRI